MAERNHETIESGAPDPMPYMHPVMKNNYGKWVFHSHPKPGVLYHRADNGEQVWTVKAGTQRQMDHYTIRKLADIADQFGDGYVRFTTRSNIEYMVTDQAKVEPLIKALTDNGFPVGGTANSVSMVAHTQGWLHCDIPGTDASGAVKALMDDLYEDFVKCEMPNRVKLSTSCCEINCGGQADIAIIVQHTKPPKINHDLVANVCERPSVVARCPVAAIRPALVNGKPSLEVDEKKCICCGACFPPSPPKQINPALAGSQRRGEEDPRDLQGRRPSVGAHERLDRPHRLAGVLREDRAALHQVPRRQLAWRSEQPERLHPHPFLTSYPGGPASRRKTAIG